MSRNKRKRTHKGINLSIAVYDRIASYKDEVGINIRRFVEDAVKERLEKVGK